MPKLSIITINLNNSKGLRKTIESVVSQTNKDFEYLIVDGGSTDGSVEIIREYSDSIAWWISEPDYGIYHAMNKGISKANGFYCQFLNSGDSLISKDVTDKMLRGTSTSSIIYGNKIKIMSNGRSVYNRKLNTESFLTFYKGTMNHATAYIKKTLFDKYGLYDEELKIVSDWKFYLMAVGLHNETVEYKDVDVVFFDMEGISNTNKTLERNERRQVLTDLLPISVIKDYDKYWFQLRQLERVNRYWWAKSIFWVIERVLFKFEKLFIK